MARSILHCDMNCFYAAVEMQRHPELRDKPLAVCGSQEDRHGIVLTANYIAKRYGVKTGMAIWQAKQNCASLEIFPPDMDEYIRFSRMAKEIYEDYTAITGMFRSEVLVFVAPALSPLILACNCLFSRKIYAGIAANSWMPPLTKYGLDTGI